MISLSTTSIVPPSGAWCGRPPEPRYAGWHRLGYPPDVKVGCAYTPAHWDPCDASWSFPSVVVQYNGATISAEQAAILGYRYLGASGAVFEPRNA